MKSTVKIVQSVPDPPVFTPEIWKQLAVEAREWHEAYVLRTSKMEMLTSDDLGVLIK